MKTQVATKNVNILSRDVIKRTGLVLYTILSSDKVNRYFATYQNGKATCECKSFEYRNTCRHSDYILQVEAMAQYDVVNKALQIVNQALIDAKIGTFYEDVVTQQEPEVLWSNVCKHRVKYDINNHCGCMA